jgi:hypothetical protein
LVTADAESLLAAIMFTGDFTVAFAAGAQMVTDGSVAPGVQDGEVEGTVT